jgi:lipoprotein-anchoring transpeptidase ErfK/SrfK
MRAMVIIIILGVVGGFGWGWYARHRQPAITALPVQAAPTSSTTSGPSSGGGTDAALSPELKNIYDQAEAMWAQESKDGSPVSSGKAPTLDKMYSAVLQGIYNKPGQKELELRLISDRLTPLGDALFFSKTRYPQDETGIFLLHEVQPGESPDRIAKKYGMSMELVNRLRGMTNLSDSNLRAGDRLKVVSVREHGGNLLHIDKSDFYLDCYIAGLFARRYPISHGAKESPTPVGHTHLVDRVIHPSWTNPKDNHVYQDGDPRNILGGVWMSFSPDGIGQSGLGIHGYTGPDAKMQAMVSNGCVRMDTPQAVELLQSLAHPDRCPTAVDIVE